MKVLKKIFNGLFIGLDNGLYYWNCGLMSAMAFFIIMTVFLRYIFNIAFNWTEELIILLFIGTTYFGLILGIKDEEHIKISLLKDKLPPKIKIIVDILISCINISVVVIIGYLSLDWIEKAGKPLTLGIKIPYGAAYTMMPIAFALVVIYEGRKIALKISDFKRRSM